MRQNSGSTKGKGRFMKTLLLCACAAVVLAGCATDPMTADSGTDKEYRTGTNIPSRDRMGVRTVSPEAIERQRDQSTGNVGHRPGMGN
jgi:hypothetical protein